MPARYCLESTFFPVKVGNQQVLERRELVHREKKQSYGAEVKFGVGDAKHLNVDQEESFSMYFLDLSLQKDQGVKQIKSNNNKTKPIAAVLEKAKIGDPFPTVSDPKAFRQHFETH